MEKNDYVKSIELYGDYYKENKDILLELLEMLRKSNQIILWGAGLKGKAFIQIIDEKCKYIDSVVDVDKKKQGHRLMTGHNVNGIDVISSQAVILIVNVKYYMSICIGLINNGYDIKKMRLISLDNYIQRDISFDAVKNNTIWKRKRYYD